MFRKHATTPASRLADELRSATVTALTDMTVLVIGRTQFTDLLADPRIAERVTAAARRGRADDTATG